jgi:hypothetical protein
MVILLKRPASFPFPPYDDSIAKLRFAIGSSLPYDNKRGLICQVRATQNCGLRTNVVHDAGEENARRLDLPAFYAGHILYNEEILYT